MVDDLNQSATGEAAPEDLLAALEKAKAENQRLTNSVSKLEAKRTEALDEAKKLKRINKLLGAVGIDSDDEDAENTLIEKLLQQKEKQGELQLEAEAQAEEAVNPAKPGKDPIQDAELKRLRRQVEKLAQQAEEAEKEKLAALEKNRQDRIERKVVEALQQAGAANPAHAFRLMSMDGKYQVSLSEGGEILGGPDYDPKPLSDVIAAFRDDDAFSYMFSGSGISGSGAGTRNGNGTASTVANNPFRMDSLNATEAARIYMNNPDKAKRLMAEAKSVGQLDPQLAKLA